MATPGFVNVGPDLLEALGAIAGTENVITDLSGVEALSKDFYWYSPVLRARLEDRHAAAAVKVTDAVVLREVLGQAARARVPVTVRGAATGNYGQCIPLCGGLVVDVSGMDRIISIDDGVVTAEPGTRLSAIENAARAKGWELRCYPSTWIKASVGGFIGGGSGGIGSITWGGLRHQGTIKRLKLLTVEETPREIVLDENDTLRAFHAYGTTGVIAEVQMRLGPARPWDQLVLASKDWDRLLDLTWRIAKDDAIPKRLVTVLEQPIPEYFKPIRKFYPHGHHLTFLEVDSAHREAVAQLAAENGISVAHTIPHHEPRRAPMLSDYTWNHTTLWAIKADPSITYLQAGFGTDFQPKLKELKRRFPDEFWFHLEFMRGDSPDGTFGEVSCGGIPLVKFTTEARLREIIDTCTELGVFIANPHTCYVEEGGRKEGYEIQRALKDQADPFGLLNPGKLKSYPPPGYAAEGAFPPFLYA